MAWHVVADADGVNHDLCRQDLDNSCAAASIAMCVRKVKNTLCSESNARDAIGKLDASIKNFRDGTAAYTWREVGIQPHAWGAALSSLGCQYAKTREAANAAGLIALLRSCGRRKPGVAGVLWDGGGGHAIVCIGRDNAGNNMLFLDPGHTGVVSIPMGNLPRYVAPYGGAGDLAEFVVLADW